VAERGYWVYDFALPDEAVEFTVPSAGRLRIRRASDDAWAQLDADLAGRRFEITHS
jgi:hypothetical protein